MLTAHVDLDLGPGLGQLWLQVCHPDPDLQRRGERARGDDADLIAAGEHRVALARNPGALDLERGELLDRAFATGGGDRGGPDEAGGLGAAPAEAGFDRVAL